jgi:hypothetical protein
MMQRDGDQELSVPLNEGNKWFRWAVVALALLMLRGEARGAERLTLNLVVTPSTVIVKDGKPVPFAIHGFIEFVSLNEAFRYIDAQRQLWTGKVNQEELQGLQRALLREAIESRVVSMADERPLETLVTHTSEELRAAIAQVKEPLPDQYVEAFLRVQHKWKHSLNCWSASPVIAGRVLSNWYAIEEGIGLYGATYDSTEHFWQAVKYHPDLTIGDLQELLQQLEAQDWTDWLKHLGDDPKIYLSNAYAVEFVRANLRSEKLRWFQQELGKHGLQPDEHARTAQQRNHSAFRFSAFEEKVLWGDLADVFHLVYFLSMSTADDPVRRKLAEKHFDGIYLNGRKLGFISEEYRSQMLEIWKVKYLEMPRFREVISGIPTEIRLEHFLNDGDSPDIPIPVYVGYLNQIRQMAKTQVKASQ